MYPNMNYGGGFGGGYGVYGGGFSGIGGSGSYSRGGFGSVPNYSQFPAFSGNGRALGFTPLLYNQKTLTSGDTVATFIGPGGGYGAGDLSGVQSAGQAAAVRFNGFGHINNYSNSFTAFRPNNTNFNPWGGGGYQYMG